MIGERLSLEELERLYVQVDKRQHTAEFVFERAAVGWPKGFSEVRQMIREGWQYDLAQAAWAAEQATSGHAQRADRAEAARQRHLRFREQVAEFLVAYADARSTFGRRKALRRIDRLVRDLGRVTA